MMGCNRRGAELSKNKGAVKQIMQNGEDLSIRRDEERAVTGQGGSFHPASAASPHGTGQERERDGAEDKTLD